MPDPGTRPAKDEQWRADYEQRANAAHGRAPEDGQSHGPSKAGCAVAWASLLPFILLWAWAISSESCDATCRSMGIAFSAVVVVWVVGAVVLGRLLFGRTDPTEAQWKELQDEIDALRRDRGTPGATDVELLKTEAGQKAVKEWRERHRLSPR